jgi:hypothetical protein
MLNSVFTTICTCLITLCLVAVVVMQVIECVALSIF